MKLELSYNNLVLKLKISNIFFTKLHQLQLVIKSEIIGK